jgi:hypothetical protein
VSECDREASTRGPGPTGGLFSCDKSHEVCRACKTCRDCEGFCWGKRIDKNPLLKPSVDVRMILKWIVKKNDGRLQSGFI